MSLQLSDVTEKVKRESSEVVPPNSFVIVTIYDHSSNGAIGKLIVPPGIRYDDIRSAVRIDQGNTKGFATLVKFT